MVKLQGELQIWNFSESSPTPNAHLVHFEIDEGHLLKEQETTTKLLMPFCSQAFF